MPKTEKLGQQLIEAGLLTQDQVKKVHEYQNSMGGSFADSVVKLGFISDNKLTNLLAQKHGLPICNLKDQVLPEGLIKRVPWQLIRKHQIVPIQQSNKTLTVAIADPMDYDAIEELQFATGLQVEFNLAPRKQIAAAIQQFAKKLGASPSGGRLRPASQGALKALSETSEADLMEEVKARSDGKLTSSNLNRADMREALIPALIRKGVISKHDLFDAVLDLLMKKGVISDRELQSMKRNG